MSKDFRGVNINISPIRGGHAPYPTDMPFGVSSGIPNVIIHAKFHVDRLRSFWAAGPQKVPIPILIGTTLTTVLHYRADCDNHRTCCRLLLFSDIDILQSSVATHLRGGGIFYYRFTTNFLLSLSVKEFWKSVSIWKS